MTSAKQYRDPCFGLPMDSANYRKCVSYFPSIWLQINKGIFNRFFLYLEWLILRNYTVTVFKLFLPSNLKGNKVLFLQKISQRRVIFFFFFNSTVNKKEFLEFVNLAGQSKFSWRRSVFVSTSDDGYYG